MVPASVASAPPARCVRNSTATPRPSGISPSHPVIRADHPASSQPAPVAIKSTTTSAETKPSVIRAALAPAARKTAINTRLSRFDAKNPANASPTASIDSVITASFPVRNVHQSLFHGALQDKCRIAPNAGTESSPHAAPDHPRDPSRDCFLLSCGAVTAQPFAFDMAALREAGPPPWQRHRQRLYRRARTRP